MQTRLTLDPDHSIEISSAPAWTALEQPAFPFEELSELAELESWRKEVNRPIYHIHKWWAQRLGSVFRGILIGAVTSDADLVMQRFYEPTRFPRVIVFDPFMGSGTTVGEALKLGMRAIGRDINPVAYFAVKNALAASARDQVVAEFQAIELDTAPQMRNFYRARLPNGDEAEALYYFWVKQIDCPTCTRSIELFSSYIFARHAYPKRYPEARAVCPSCGAVNVTRYDARDVTCDHCRNAFDASVGPANGAKVTCHHCGETVSIIEALRQMGTPPRHRMYAKLVLDRGGAKHYLPADDYDHLVYQEAVEALDACLEPFPIVPITTGRNTNQILNYGYRYWHQLFNDRQLLNLSLLIDRIRQIEDDARRELFICLLSGTLEFNNMFASYKGEGTGAVRHMFAHHILKPERTPLEANLWGTPKSSGAFSTLFRSRLLRALDYRDKPFEIRSARNGSQRGSEKVYGLSARLDSPVAGCYEDFANRHDVYLSCGDSAQTDLPDESVDLVVTDPPFFDNVHYSELADFFHVWQQHMLAPKLVHTGLSTRSPNEVQSTSPAVFAERLRGVFVEAHRVLRPSGLLILTYHHSRAEGWAAILDGIMGAGFIVTATQPIRSEMSGATPKQQAREPINLDVVVICRKREFSGRDDSDPEGGHRSVIQAAREQVERFQLKGRRLSRNDVRVVVMGQVIRELSERSSYQVARAALEGGLASIEANIEQLFQDQLVLSALDEAGS